MSMKIRGKAVDSTGLGKILGFPTINLAYSGEISGVFVGRAKLNNQYHQAAVNVGGRPTVDNEKFCEVHLLDWHGEIERGAKIEVELLQKIREVQRFSGLDTLKAQIMKDVQSVREWYNLPENKEKC
jgi:riboflavin kinase/FMN adenylyltransferase